MSPGLGGVLQLVKQVTRRLHCDVLAAPLHMALTPPAAYVDVPFEATALHNQKDAAGATVAPLALNNRNLIRVFLS